MALARALLRAAVLIAIVLVWLAGTKGPASGLARNLAILTPATMLLGLVLSMGTPTEGGHGLMRLLMTAVLAYAILQHQLLGIDVKLRWGISKTTVAAVFIAVFFIASEAAQQFFGDRFESSYLGILAAGALVFAIAPLSRVADRLAEKAVPVPASASMPPQPSHLHERYRVLMRRYLGDGRLNRDEELALAHAAAGMGIPTHIALQLRHEVEDENAFERLAAEQDVPADAAARRR